jgi:hypothetical protein
MVQMIFLPERYQFILCLVFFNFDFDEFNWRFEMIFGAHWKQWNSFVAT